MNDQGLNLQFVEEVEKHEVLYNYQLPGYSRKDITDKAWEEVAAKFYMTAVECKERWRNLRTVFIRKMKPLPSGSGRRKRAYYLADAMQFCVPFIKALAPASTEYLPQVAQRGTTDDFLEISLKCDDDVDSQGDSSDTVQSSQAPLAPPPAHAQFCFPRASPDRTALPQDCLEESTSGLTVRNESEVDAGKCVAEYFKAKKARLEVEAAAIKEATSSRDVDRKMALEMFLLSLIPELEEFNDSQIKIFKRKIFSVIDEISASPQLHHSQFVTWHSPHSGSTHISDIPRT